MDEFDGLREAWEAFTAPLWDVVGRIKGKMTKILDMLLEEVTYVE